MAVDAEALGVQGQCAKMRQPRSRMRQETVDGQGLNTGEVDGWRMRGRNSFLASFLRCVGSCLEPA